MVGFSNSINTLGSPLVNKITNLKSWDTKSTPKIQSGGGNPQRAIAKKRKPQIEIKRSKPKNKKKRH